MSSKPKYPPTHTEDVEDELAGLRFADPYHWLEAETDEVRSWQRAQAELASSTVRAWPHFDALKTLVIRYNTDRFASGRRSVGGQWYRIVPKAGAAHSVAVVSETLTDEGRVLYDPASESSDNPPYLSWISPSPDGRYLALGVCADGSENNNIRLIDVATGARLPNAPTETLMDTWSGGAHWLADASGFYFAALAGSTHDFQQRIFFHKLRDGGSTKMVDVPLPRDSRDYHVVRPSQCGRWIVATQRMLSPIPVALLDLTKNDGWRPFITEVDGTVAGQVIGDRYVAVTDVGAPRGRIVGIPLASQTPNDPATWQELVPESEAVIRTLRRVGDTLYVAEFVDTYARIRLFSLSGAPLGIVPLPGNGALAELPFPMMNLCAPYDETALVFDFSTLKSSWATYSHRPGAVDVEQLVAPQVTLENVMVEDRWATSADGTRIPYHILRLKIAGPDQARPAMLYAYGGFNAPWIPQFPGPMASFAASGGLFVHCHLRGGGEFGRDWWYGGTQKNKEKGYQDLYAIAEDLIARGITTPDLLAVTGGSNGGLMSGVALTQRPDLWRAVVPRVPLLDIVGAARDPYGRVAIVIDFGNPDDPDEVRRLARFSPYQLVKDGVAYPAVYIDAGDTDPRCPPWHSRKFAARLQAAQGGEAPILLHIWENVGHGWATAKDVQIEEHSEWLAFVMQQLGVVPANAAVR